jgi:hypothetical protein
LLGCGGKRAVKGEARRGWAEGGAQGGGGEQRKGVQQKGSEEGADAGEGLCGREVGGERGDETGGGVADAGVGVAEEGGHLGRHLGGGRGLLERGRREMLGEKGVSERVRGMRSGELAWWKKAIPICGVEGRRVGRKG